MNCVDVRRWLARDLDGEAEPSADAAAHLERCAGCREEAGRLKSISAATRAALPRAAVPLDFGERVMAHVLPPADEALGERARPRLRRWWPLLVPVLALAVWPLLRPGAPDAPEETPLAPLAQASLGGARVTALGPALVRDGALHGGAALVETGDEPAAIETPLGTIRLAPHSRGVARFGTTKEETMNPRLVPTVLTLTLLAGNGAVATAQGEADAGRNAPVRVVKGQPPVIDAEALRAEMERIRALVADANERLAEVAEQLAAVRGVADDLIQDVRDVRAEEVARRLMEKEAARRLTEKSELERREQELKEREREIARLREELEQYRRRRDEIEAVDRVRTDALAQRLERARALRQRIDELVARMRAICAEGGLPTQRQVDDLGRWYEELREVEALAIARKRLDAARDARSAYERAYEYFKLATRLRELDAFRTYEVKPGDTLASIARARLGDPARAREILEANPGLAPDRLRPGQRINLPIAREEFEELRMRLAGEVEDHDEAEPVRKPKAAGRVLETRGNIVAISVGTQDGVKVGDVFQVTRGWKYVGQVVVTKVYKGQSVAEFDAEHPGDAAPVAAGDVIRPNRRR